MSQTIENPASGLASGETPLCREPRLAEKVVFVDGLFGCGKTLFSAIVGAFARVEVEKYNYPLEYVCALHFLGKLPADAAVAMARLLTDLDLYNLMMSREANFRFSDLSSIWKHPGRWRYLKRLAQPGDAAVLPRIQNERPILNLVTHLLLPISAPIQKGLGDRFRMVEVVRHPLYMLKQWHLYNHRLGQDARDFTIWFDYKGESLPWFVRGIEELYLEANRMDRVIYAIHHVWQMAQKRIETMTESERAGVLIIPFERFVIDPWPALNALEKLLDTQATAVTRRVLKQQRVPRQKFAEGLPLEIYKEYGWQSSQRGSSEKDELSYRRQFAAQEASPAAMKLLDQMCLRYEETHMRGLLP